MDLEARSWDKNRALLSTLCGPRTTSIVGRLERVWILYAGDTDDDVMEASNGLAFTFRVSRVPVYHWTAYYRRIDHEAVQSLS